MGSSSETIEVNATSDSVELLILPEDNSTVSIDFFIDRQGDNNQSNGTPVPNTFLFEIAPLTSNGLGVTVNAAGSEWISEGTAQVSLEPASTE